MRALINYIRSCFCKHDFELLGTARVYTGWEHRLPIGMKWTYRCKKCGYIKKYKDY